MSGLQRREVQFDPHGTPLILTAVTRGLSADGGFLASAIWRLFRQGLGAGMFSGSVQFSKPTEARRQLPQVPSGNRRPQTTGVCASQPSAKLEAEWIATPFS
jgi:hypothetical protein